MVSAGQRLLGGYDTYLLFFEAAQAGRLLLINLLVAVPFFFGALAIGLILVRHVERIGSLYFANLLGSGLGGVVAVILLGFFAPERLPALVALFALAAAFLLVRYREKAHRLAAWCTPLTIAVFLLVPPSLKLSEYKDLQGALNLPGAKIVARRDSPYGQVHLVTGAALRHAPGLSLAYPGQVAQQDAVFSNGNWFGAVPSSPAGGELSPLDFTTSALPYTLKGAGNVLVLHSGSGEEALRALARGADRVVAVEPHRAVLALLDDHYTDGLSGPWKERLERVTLEPRTWLATDTDRYDLIVLPTVGVFGGAVGLGALLEQHIYTREAFAEIWNHLETDGLFSVTAWIDYPARSPLRLAATLAEMLEAEGLEKPRAHIAAVRSWGTLTFCVKRSPFSREETAIVRDFSRRMLFDPALLPELRPEERQRYNLLQDPRLLDDLERLFGPDREELYP